MSVPQWLEGVLSEFARATGIETFGFGANDTAALAFDNGSALIFEYSYPNLTVMMTAPAEMSPETARRVLSFVIPERQRGPLLRAGFLPRGDRLFFAVSLEHREISLPALNEAFALLRRHTDQFIGGNA